jgi:ERCC4-related helicase
VNSQKSVENNLRIGYIHGDCGCNYEGHNHTEDCHFSKSDRIKKLRNRDYDVMLATDIIGRGIDIRTVTLVFNYSEPFNKNKGISETNYIHRVGRTGRYTDTGVAVSFVKDNRLV